MGLPKIDAIRDTLKVVDISKLRDMLNHKYILRLKLMQEIHAFLGNKKSVKTQVDIFRQLSR